MKVQRWLARNLVLNSRTMDKHNSNFIISTKPNVFTVIHKASLAHDAIRKVN